MKLAILAVLVLGALAVTDQEQWEMFKAQYNKDYKMMGASEEYRFTVFQSNLRKAEEIQAGDSQATYGVTQFMDMTPEEFRSMYANLNVTQVSKWHASLPKLPLQHSRQMGVDWKAKGFVSSVKDQGQCGSCWAFSAAAAAEGCYAIKNQKSIDLSAQQIVDCCTAGGSNGCNGGWPDQCLSWAMQHNIATWAAYPYHTSKGTCKDSGFEIGLSAGTCKYYGVTGGESATKLALNNNVVSICLDANPLQYYRGGIISGTTCNNKQVDHAVLLVADDGGVYTVKNSWGSGWGESGYFRMAMDVNCLSFTSYNSQAY
jgi:C1A family cysteine protease